MAPRHVKAHGTCSRCGRCLNKRRLGCTTTICTCPGTTALQPGAPASRPKASAAPQLPERSPQPDRPAKRALLSPGGLREEKLFDEAGLGRNVEHVDPDARAARAKLRAVSDAMDVDPLYRVAGEWSQADPANKRRAINGVAAVLTAVAAHVVKDPTSLVRAVAHKLRKEHGDASWLTPSRQVQHARASAHSHA